MNGTSRALMLVAALCILDPLRVASAEGVCAAELCELDCAKKVPSIAGIRNPKDYEACLATERACRAGIPAAQVACQANRNYQAGLLLGKEATSRGVLTSLEQCRNETGWISNIVRQTGGDTVGRVSDACGCFFCEEIIDTAISDGDLQTGETAPAARPAPPPAPVLTRPGRGKPPETCDEWIAQIRKIDSVPANSRGTFCRTLGEGLRATCPIGRTPPYSC